MYLNLNKGNIDHINTYITSNEIEAVIESLNKKSPEPYRLTAEFYQIFK
jgi:hypothetical protein